MSTLFVKLLKTTLLKEIIIALAKEGASRTDTKWDDKAVDVIESVLLGTPVESLEAVIKNTDKH